MPKPYTPLTIEIAIEKLLARSRIGALVSIRDMIAKVRSSVPDAQFSDAELGDRIARFAIAKSCSISFDAESAMEERHERSSRTAA